MTINPELESALLAYLQTRPWKETNNLIVALYQAKQAAKPDAGPEHEQTKEDA